jgi:1-acyl-sn-glycerol-3-phosphate acyltransferase
MILVIAPEGTRRKVERWRSGFYHIARGAKVPIVLGYLDYGRKAGGIGPAVTPTGDIEADMKQIRAFYADVTPKHPERMSNSVAQASI